MTSSQNKRKPALAKALPEKVPDEPTTSTAITKTTEEPQMMTAAVQEHMEAKQHRNGIGRHNAHSAVAAPPLAAAVTEQETPSKAIIAFRGAVTMLLEELAEVDHQALELAAKKAALQKAIKDALELPGVAAASTVSLPNGEQNGTLTPFRQHKRHVELTPRAPSPRLLPMRSSDTAKHIPVQSRPGRLPRKTWPEGAEPRYLRGTRDLMHRSPQVVGLQKEAILEAIDEAGPTGRTSIELQKQFRCEKNVLQRPLSELREERKVATKGQKLYMRYFKAGR